MDSSKLPNFRITACCRNCLFYKPRGTGERGRAIGYCHVKKETEPDNKPIATHATCVCDAHIYKTVTKHVKQISIKYGAELPEDL